MHLHTFLHSLPSVLSLKLQDKDAKHVGFADKSRARRRGSQFLAFCTKIDSSVVVKFHQS